MNLSRLKKLAYIVAIVFGDALAVADAQTLYTPDGSVGSSSNSGIGIGTSSPGAKLDVRGDLRVGDGSFEVVNYVKTQPWTFASRPAGWYRIAAGASNGGRNSATFELREYADHSNLEFHVGASYNKINGASVTVLNHSVFSGSTFQKLRLLTKSTYDVMYIEVYISPHNNDNQPFWCLCKDNLQDGWTLINFDPGSIPTGYTATEYRVADVFVAAGGAGDIASFRVDRQGNVGIGTTDPTHKLSVNGTIRAKEVIVEASPWPDDVFEEGYKLKALSEVAAHIETEGHLPDVPNAATIAEQGVVLGEMQATLLRKIEELTLYMIAQEKRAAAQEEEIKALHAKVEQLQALVPASNR